MCGIAGSLGYPDTTRTARMLGAIQHRGPDSCGEYHRGAIGLGARRLSIVDLTGGDQPIANAAGTRVIAFNGEIYNYRELQHHLRQRGRILRTNVDTEVILHLYEEYGAGCVHYLRGMFAFAIADGETLFIARDRFGIKPLFYCCCERDGRQVFLFASEIKALLQCPEVRVELDYQTIIDTHLLTHTVGSRTCFRGIHSLDAGCSLRVRQHRGGLLLDKRRYYQSRLEPDDSISLEDARERLQEILVDTVKAHLVADVEIGLLLSGGLDSGILAALMRRATTAPVRAFTIASSEHADVHGAREVARLLGLTHEIRWPTFSEYVATIPRWVASVETITRFGGLSVLLLAQSVRQYMKVCLCGEGSDEIFGGYTDFGGRFVNLEAFRRRLPRIRAAGFEPSPALIEVVDEIEAAERMGRECHLRAIFRYHQQHALVPNHLEPYDKAGMAAGVEIRVPYMDHVLVDFVNRLPMAYKVGPTGNRKHILRLVALRDSPDALRGAVARSKLGMPSACADYMQRFELLCRRLLPDHYGRRHELAACFQRQSQLVMFALFELIFVENRGIVPSDFDMIDFVRSLPVRSGYRTRRKNPRGLSETMNRSRSRSMTNS